MADERVTVLRFGLWRADCRLPLHDPGSIGASLAEEKAITSESEVCELVDAAAWFEDNLQTDDVVYCKLNCEGAECDVLDRLIECQQLHKISHLLVHFDVEKVSSLAERAPVTRARLHESGIEWREARQIMFGRSHRLKTANWLAWCEASRAGRLRYSVAARMSFAVRRTLYPIKVRWTARKRHEAQSPRMPG